MNAGQGMSKIRVLFTCAILVDLTEGESVDLQSHSAEISLTRLESGRGGVLAI